MTNLEDPLNLALLALAGAVGYVALQQWWTGSVRHPDPLHRWVGIWSGLTTVWIAGRFMQRTSADPVIAEWGVRVEVATGIALLWVAGPAVRSLAREPRIPRAFHAWTALMGALALLALFTDLLVTGPALVSFDGLGREVWMLEPTGALYVILPLGLGAAAYIAHAARRARPHEPWHANVWILAVAVMMVTGLNDVFLPMGLPSIHLAEWGFAVVSLSLAYSVNRRMGRVQQGLEAAVEERTEELSKRRDALESTLKALRRSEQRFRTLTEATLEGIVVCRDTEVIDANVTAEAIFGCGPRELLGKEVVSLFGAHDDASMERVVPRDGESMETVGRRLDGATFPMEVASRALRSVASDAFVLVIRDMTEQHEMRARLVLADRLVSVGTLAAGAAHEINNPLTYTMANLDLVLESLKAGEHLDADRLSELLREARDGAERVRLVVRDLRDLARREDEQTAPGDVRAVLERALQMANNEIRHRARVVKEIEDQLPGVDGSEARLGQVFLNLLVNGAHAIPVGAADLNEIRVRAGASGGRVWVEIEDTGLGIAEDALDRVFDPFFSTKGPGRGMGLGLAICHNIVVGLGGTITVQSRIEVGTTFRVELPASERPLPEAAQSSMDLEEQPAQRARILVVDDEPAVGRAMKRILAAHQVTVASSGREALQHCEDHGWDLVLCDLMMPDVTGMDVFDQLSRRTPELAARFVFMTGGAFTDQGREFLARVPNPTLEKPVNVKELRALVLERVREA